MSGIWIVAALLSFACVAVLFYAMMRRGSDAGLTAQASSLAIYKDQLAEVDRDLDRGTLTHAQADAARTEIKRRILSLSDTSQRVSAGSSDLIVVSLAGILVPVLAFGLYAKLGQPNLPSLPYADRTAELEQDRDIKALTAKLRAQLENEPNGGALEGWMLLGQTYMRQNRYGDAAYAFGQIATRPDADSVVLSRYAEALVASENGTVTPQAMAVFDRALVMQPLNPAPIYYKALGLEQAGDIKGAYGLLADRIGQSTQLEPWMESFAQQANRLAALAGKPAIDLGTKTRPKGPTEQQIEDAQSMTPQDQQAFIESMVSGLAARLEDTPNDIDGWLQLARAYGVLGRDDDALAAYKSAEALMDALPQNDPRRAIITNALAR